MKTSRECQKFIDAWFPRLIVVPLSSHEVDGVRKEKERLTAIKYAAEDLAAIHVSFTIGNVPANNSSSERELAWDLQTADFSVMIEIDDVGKLTGDWRFPLPLPAWNERSTGNEQQAMSSVILFGPGVVNVSTSPKQE